MSIPVFQCGAPVNESEVSAIEHLKSQLQNSGGSDEWVILTNLAFSVTHQFQSDEIDLVVIGPTGVHVIEVKHWTSQWVDSHQHLVEQEAEKVTNKARKIGTTLRRIVRDLARVDGTILSTQAPSKVKKLVAKLGSGNGGANFKVVEIALATGRNSERTLRRSLLFVRLSFNVNCETFR